MSKTEKDVAKRIILRTGLRRGNVVAVAGDTLDVAEIGPGLARRLIERGQAVPADKDAARTAKKLREAAEVAKRGTPPPPPEVKGGAASEEGEAPPEPDTAGGAGAE